MIHTTHLVKRYKNITAVDGINLNIKEGEIFGLLGPNGAGKSTTICCLLGLIKTDDGDIVIDGKKLKNSYKDIKKIVGYVPQDFAFFEELNAIDNVNYWGRIYGFKGEELKKRVKEALEFTGLWERRKDRASTFSGGMKRRLNIACGIVHGPKILFMDEPTAGVDPQSRNNILESVKTLNQRGTTIVYTSHYMEEIESICDRVAIVDFGKIIAEGTVDELIDKNTTKNTIRIAAEDVSEDTKQLLCGTVGVIDTEYKDGVYTIHTTKDEDSFKNLILQLAGSSMDLKSIEVHKPDLEDVFLQLTGKQIRE
jgi:ABC-type multidrug transport system, ATPase component